MKNSGLIAALAHIEHYEAGHMMYVHPGSMAKFSETTKAFIVENST